MADFQPCVAFTLRPENEGAYVDNPADPGGPTNFGITLEGLSEWRRTHCTAEDIRELTMSEARNIYEANYWRPIGGDYLAPGIDLMVFDFGVNHGPGSAIKMLQRLVGVAEDGDVGPNTLKRAQCAGTVLRTRVASLAAAQEAFYASLHSQIFGKGWLARTKRRQTAALALTTKAPAVAPAPTVAKPSPPAGKPVPAKAKVKSSHQGA